MVVFEIEILDVIFQNQSDGGCKCQNFYDEFDDEGGEWEVVGCFKKKFKKVLWFGKNYFGLEFFFKVCLNFKFNFINLCDLVIYIFVDGLVFQWISVMY